MPRDIRFTHSPAQLQQLAQDVLDAARRAGASACECEVSEGSGLSVTVRMGQPETIEHNRDKSLGVTLYYGERPQARRGHASTSDFSTAALASTALLMGIVVGGRVARRAATDR